MVKNIYYQKLKKWFGKLSNYLVISVNQIKGDDDWII